MERADTTDRKGKNEKVTQYSNTQNTKYSRHARIAGISETDTPGMGRTRHERRSAGRAIYNYRWSFALSLCDARLASTRRRGRVVHGKSDGQ